MIRFFATTIVLSAALLSTAYVTHATPSDAENAEISAEQRQIKTIKQDIARLRAQKESHAIHLQRIRDTWAEQDAIRDEQLEHLESQSALTQKQIDEQKELQANLRAQLDELAIAQEHALAQSSALQQALAQERSELIKRYNRLPDLLREHAQFEARLSEADTSLNPLQQEKLHQSATAELAQLGSRIWQGRQTIQDDKQQRLVNVIYFGVIGGCWLSLDGSDGGWLMPGPAGWSVSRAGAHLELLAICFEQARTSRAFCMPLPLPAAEKVFAEIADKPTNESNSPEVHP